MNESLRAALIPLAFAFACNAPSSDLFAPSGSSPPQVLGGSSGNAGGTSNVAGTGAVAPGGTSMVAGEGNVAIPGAGTAGTGQPSGEGGTGGGPVSGAAGADEGTGGATEPPLEPVCGNGKLEVGEECDDMGRAGQDGCSAACQVVCSDFGEAAVESEDHHCYHGYDEADFEGAQQDCVGRGAHLVTISSSAENAIAAGFVNSSKFIGGFENVGLMDDSAGQYEWVTGEPFSYENWGSEEPNRNGVRCSNSGPIGQGCYAHCARMEGGGEWSDLRCDLEDGYICEWEPAGS